MKGSEFLLFLILCILVLAALGSKAETTQEEPVIEPPVEEVEAQRDTLSDWDELILAIAYTESKFNPDAVGANGDFGCLQITKVFVDEANRISGLNYEHEDAFDIDSSLEMFALIQDHYNADHDLDKAIRLHNKSDAYRRTVLNNLQLIRNYEKIRGRLTEQ